MNTCSLERAISAQLLGRSTFDSNFNELYMDSEKGETSLITRGCLLFILIANEFVTSCWIAYIPSVYFFSFNSLVLFFYFFFQIDIQKQMSITYVHVFFQTYYGRINWTFTHVRNFNELINIFFDLLQATATRLRSLNLSRAGPPPPPLKTGSRTHWSLSCN